MPTHKPTPSPARIIKIALEEVGYQEGRSRGHWNNHQRYSPAVPGLEWSQNQPWCATFVSWAAMQADLAGYYPRTASCDAAGKWFKDRGRWSEYPAIGAQVFFGTRADLNHTGIVYDFDATYVYTIEGNTNASGSREGDGVYRKKHLRRADRVVGYGLPKFPEGIVSADPAFKDQLPKPPVSVPAGHTPNGPAAASQHLVKLHHSSLQFSDTPAQQKADVERIFAMGRDVLTWTEASEGNPLRKFIKEIGPRYGYQVHTTYAGVGVAVHESYGVVTRNGFEFVASGVKRQYTDRGIAWSEVLTPGGKVITFGAVHYVTKGRTPAAGLRYRINEKFARIIGTWAKRHGLGAPIVFLSGDFNIIDKVQDVFFGQPLTTCWDELRKWPNTGHGNIDAIASYDADDQVTCVGARAFTDDDVPLYTDHFTIAATYMIGPGPTPKEK